MSRPAAAALVVLACVAGAAAVAFTWQPGLATFHDDSASYLVMAQAFSPWHPASAAVMAQMPYEKYPPLFPLALAWLGAAHDWHWAHAFVAVAFGASVALLGWFTARVSGEPWVGVAAAAVYAAMPGVWLNVMGILSEFPYMALTFGTLAWLAPRMRAALSPRDAAILAALLAAAMLMRTIGFTLWLAVGVAAAMQYARTRDRLLLRRAAIALAAAAAATAAWYVLRPAGGEDAYVSQSAGVAARARSEGIGWIFTLVASNASAIVDAWLNTLVIYWGEWWQPRFLAMVAIGAAALAAVAWRARRGEVDALYVLLFLAVLAMWPFPGQMYRLALPVFPLAVAIALATLHQLAARRVAGRQAARIAGYAALVPLAFCAPALFYIADRGQLANRTIMELYRIPFRPAAEAAAARQALGFEDMARIRDTTPEGARVMGYGPTYIALLAGRIAVPLDYPADAADLHAQVIRARPDYVYLSRVHPRDSAHRLGDPFGPARYLEGKADVAWSRPGPAGEPEAALLRIREGAR